MLTLRSEPAEAHDAIGLHSDLLVVIATRFELQGLGIDEATALVVRGNVRDVVGDSRPSSTREYRRINDLPYLSFVAGQKHDLPNRKVIPPASDGDTGGDGKRLQRES